MKNSINKKNRVFPLSDREIAEGNARAVRASANPSQYSDLIGLALASASGWVTPSHEKADRDNGNDREVLAAVERFFTDVETINGSFWDSLGGLSHLSFLPAGLFSGWKNGSPVSLFLDGGLALVTGDRDEAIYIAVVSDTVKGEVAEVVVVHGRDVIGQYKTPVEVWGALSAYIAKGVEQ